jgi:hypothetical protein
MKTFTATLIASIVVSQLGVSLAAPSENSPARDLAAAKSFAFGGIGVAGLMSEGERNCEPFSSNPMPRSSYKLRLLMRRRQASSTFWLACGAVIALRTRRFLRPWHLLTIRLKWPVDA